MLKRAEVLSYGKVNFGVIWSSATPTHSTRTISDVTPSISTCFDARRCRTKRNSHSRSTPVARTEPERDEQRDAVPRSILPEPRHRDEVRETAGDPEEDRDDVHRAELRDEPARGRPVPVAQTECEHGTQAPHEADRPERPERRARGLAGQDLSLVRRLREGPELLDAVPGRRKHELDGAQAVEILVLERPVRGRGVLAALDARDHERRVVDDERTERRHADQGEEHERTPVAIAGRADDRQHGQDRHHERGVLRVAHAHDDADDERDGKSPASPGLVVRAV